MMRLKGRGDPATQLGDELGVRYVVEGSVRKAGERIRVTTRLVDRVGGDHTELRRHDGTLDDVFAIQEEVAREVLAQLPGAPSRAMRRRFVERPIADPGAFDAYLRARHEAWRFSADGLARARRYIDAGLAIVGDNALLYSTLGHILAMAHESGIEPGAETLARVEELSRTVSALDPDHGRGHWLRGFAAFQKGALGEAIEAGEAALASDPADPDTLLLLGYVYVHVGRNREARDLFSRAIDVDPLTPLTRCMPGMVDLMEGRYGGAVAAYRQAREMDPESPFSVFMYGWVLAQAGRSSEAIGELAATAERFPDTVFGLLAASLAAGLDGRRAQARAPLAGLAGAGQGSEMIARLLCHAHTLAGERERGLDWLDRAIDLGMLNRGFLETHDRLVAPLRSEPRFARLMERVGRRLAALA
jgi:tetratricopeptide (TPR) repeat protein